ncbi:acid protease [Lactarius psammicola]|nr:acid protease [Lactarius psammicola]
MRPLGLLVSPFFVSHFAAAVIVPFRGFPRTSDTHILSKRNNLTGVAVENAKNILYAANITLGGTPFSVVLDTGSSDLWVAGDVPGTQDTGKPADVAYAIGEAKVLVNDTSTFSSSLKSNGFQGLMGLGFDDGSIVRGILGDGQGDTPLSRIFQQNKTTQNFVSILLDREDDPTDSVTGQITVSEFASGYESIESQTKLYIKDVFFDTSSQHWAVYIDKNGVTGPDGNVISLTSIVPRVRGGKLIAVLDSGFTFSQVPRKMADAIYGRVQGANYSQEDGLWKVPCDQELNISFTFAGVKMPVHPLDTVSNDFNLGSYCVGTYQPITTAFSVLGDYDMILGMSFMRNVYALFDYGNYVDDTSNDRGDPYVQLLSVTDATSAHADFVKTRLNGTDTTGSSSKTLLPASQESHSPLSPGEKKQHIVGAVARNWPYILVGCLVFVLSVVGCCIYACCCRKRRKGVRALNKNPYQTIQEPAPPPMHMKPMNSGAQYADPYHSRA